MNSLRRTLNVEALEDRTLLSAPSGLVQAGLDLRGILTLLGDAGNNSVLLGPSLPGSLRVAGQPFTSVNGVTFTDVPLSAITSTNVNLLGGNNSVNISGFSIPGNLTVTGGSGTNTVAATNFNANQVNITTSNNSNISLNGVKTGATSIITGSGTDSINLSGVTTGTAVINSGSNNANIAISGPAIGNLSLTAGVPGVAGNSTVSVTGSQIARANINVSGVAQDGGTQNVTVSNNTFTSGAPGSLNLTVGQPGVASSYQVTVANNVFNTNSPNVLNNGSLIVNVGDAFVPDNDHAASTLTVSGLSGFNQASISTGQNLSAVTLDSLTGRSLNVNSGGSTSNFSLTNTTIAGPVSVTVGDNATNVTVSNLLTSVTPLDLALGRQADLNLNLGNGAQNVSLNSISAGRNFTLTNGTGDTTLSVANVLVGQDANVNTGNGGTALFLDNVRVSNQLTVQTGGGLNGIAAHNVTAAFGFIDGSAAPAASNTYWDQGGNSGFAALNFGNFLLGAASNDAGLASAVGGGILGSGNNAGLLLALR